MDTFYQPPFSATSNDIPSLLLTAFCDSAKHTDYLLNHVFGGTAVRDAKGARTGVLTCI
jgi:hypothetical protein